MYPIASERIPTGLNKSKHIRNFLKQPKTCKVQALRTIHRDLKTNQNSE